MKTTDVEKARPAARGGGKRRFRAKKAPPPPGIVPCAPEALVSPGYFPVIDRERFAGRSYLDSAATTQKPVQVIEALRRFYSEGYANVHRGLYRLSAGATEAFESARLRIGRFVGAEHPDREIILTGGTTAAINLAANGLCGRLRRGDEIVLTTMEHHSNLVPWQMAAARTGARLVEVRPSAEGVIPEGALEGALGRRTRIVAMVHVSNVLGTINDVARAASAAREAGAVFLVDGAQALCHLPVDVRRIGCDLYAGSGHKMFGPGGTGFLYGRREVLETLDPFMGGGDMIEEVRFDRATYAPLPARLEAGTPNVAGVVGLGAAAAFLERIGMERVRRHDRALLDRALSVLSRYPWIEIYGPRDGAVRSGLVSFNLLGVHAHDTAGALDAFGVSVRAGHLCAQPLLRHLGQRSCVRASFALYNGGSDVDRLAVALEKTASFFGIR